MSSPVTSSGLADWSAEQIAAALDAGRVVINPLIYAEVSVGYDTVGQYSASVHPNQIGRGRARSALPRWNCCGRWAPTMSSFLVAVKSSPRALWQVEQAKMMGGCYRCGIAGMLLNVSI